MRKIISMILVFAIIFSFTSNASASELIRTGKDESFSFYNEGKLVTVKIRRMGNSAASEVYIDGVLSQKSVGSLTTKTINTKVYDLSAPLRYNAAKETVSKIGDFNSFTTHEPVSNIKIDEKINANSVKSIRRSITDEPVDNTGLSQSYFGGGYYYLGEYGGFYYAPDVYAQLHRKYSSKYEGETKTWRWGENETLGAISAYLSLFFGPSLVGFIVTALFFTAQGVIAYAQSIKLATFSFYYTYMVTIKYKSYYGAWRDMTYWKIENTTAGTTKWKLKSFNGGFGVSNTEMVKAGIDNYVAQK